MGFRGTWKVTKLTRSRTMHAITMLPAEIAPRRRASAYKSLAERDLGTVVIVPSGLAAFL